MPQIFKVLLQVENLIQKGLFNIIMKVNNSIKTILYRSDCLKYYYLVTISLDQINFGNLGKTKLQSNFFLKFYYISSLKSVLLIDR